MRVLMFGWEFPPHISGGLGTACYEMTRALSHHGIDVLFVIPRTQGREKKSHLTLLSAARYPVRSTRQPQDGPPISLPHLRLTPVESPLHPYLDADSYARLREPPPPRGSHPASARTSVIPISGGYGTDLISEVVRYADVAGSVADGESFDVIHIHDWMTVLAGIHARQVSGKPLIFHVHATEYDRSGDHPDPGIVEIEKLGMQQADHIIAVSHYTRQIILQRYGIPPEKVSVVHNAVSRRNARHVYHVSRKPARRIVLFLGRITHQKGPDYFVEAAALVLKKLPDVMFVMAGSGDMLPRMIERVGQLRIGRHFHFTGFLRGDDVEKMYAMSDLYVMPSVSEPFGISPLEAMLYDVPVIVSRHSGVSEILRHALKVDFWDVPDIANKIMAVLQYPALSKEMLKNGRKELRAIRWEAAAEKIVTLYTELCSRPPGKTP